LIVGAIVTGLAALSLSVPAEALTSRECSTKYKAAQAAGTAGNRKYADYRKAEYGTSAAAAPAAPPLPPPGGRRTSAAPITAKLPPVAGAVVFPTALSPKYSAEPAGRQRMHTCLDQYNANKATNGNAGLKWIEKGGGYYSQCNARLKS
jgi:hypothetical protein